MFVRKKRGGRKKVGRKTCVKKIDELVLVASKLRFCPEQLQNLNFLLCKKLDEVKIARDDEHNIVLARSVTERLVQRLVCGVGLADEKFATKFLVHLHDNNDRSTSLQYLIRLDALSSPSLYKDEYPPKYSIIENDPDFPKGYARIRMFSSFYKIWGEYANSHGYLRRDKIQARYVELMAMAAAAEAPSTPSNLDESFLCASPGKVVDASTLHQILKTPSEEHVFYGTNGCAPRFPDPRDFRLAIVDEPSGIRLRVEFLSPALSSICMNVRLLIGVETDSWPISTDFPSRIPLGHSDSLLYQSSAQNGVYLVGYGVQSSAWQMRFLSAEETIMKNYSANSTVANILKVTDFILSELYSESARHQKYQQSYRILNSYIFKTCLYFELEKDFNSPTMALLNWSPQTLSLHVLKILDGLIASLRRQKLPNYFFSGANLLANPGHLCEDDYVYDSKLVLAYMVKLFDLGLMSTAGNAEFDRFMIAQDLEVVLLCKWKELVDGLLPPGSTRGRRFCFAGTKSRREVAYTQYTGRQMEYIGLLLKAALNVKKNALQPLDETWEDYIPYNAKPNESTTDDIIYILLTIIEQARDHYLRNNPAKLVKQKLANHFDATILKLAECVRKADETIRDDVDFVKVTLKWLYRALDQNKRLLAPILRPYLAILFISSHGNAWFLESIKRRGQRDELQAMGAFARLVNENRITPAAGLVDCVNKKWSWAKEMLHLVEKENLRVVFVGGRDRIGRHVLSVPREAPGKGQDEEEQKECVKFSTLPKKSYFCTILKNGVHEDDAKVPWHCILRDNSPMTRIISKTHRFGDHRCSGDIVQTLLSMQKMNLLQDISSILPQEDRIQLLELLHKFSSETKRNTIKKRSQTLPNTQSTYSMEAYQKYTPKEESAGVRVQGKRTKNSKSVLEVNKLELDAGTLLESCRAARIRDDSSFVYDNGNIRTLLRSKDSFRKQ